MPLPRSAIEGLRAHRTRQAEEQLAAAETWRDNGLVFTTEIGTPLEPRNVLRRFELLAQNAGLKGVHLHTLRHGGQLPAGGRHPHNGCPGALGHPSYVITADIYSHVGPALQREAADRLDAALRW